MVTRIASKKQRQQISARARAKATDKKKLSLEERIKAIEKILDI